MNLDERLKEFKQFENDDQAFWDKVIGGEEPEVPPEVLDGTARLRATEQVVVHGEIVESLWEEDFTTVEDQQIVEDLRERLKLYGLDPSQAEEMVKKAQQSPLRKRSAVRTLLGTAAARMGRSHEAAERASQASSQNTSQPCRVVDDTVRS